MSRLDRLPALPEGYGLVRAGRGALAVLEELRESVERAGFSADARFDDERLPDAEESGREALGRLSVGGRDALVRRFTHGGLARRLTGRVFRDPSRPFRELRASEALRAHGVETPRVLAARAVGVLGGFELALVTRRLAGTRDLGRLLGDVRAGRAPKAVLRRALVDAARLVAELHAIGFVHADLQPANLLVREDGPRGAIAIDLDRSYFVTTGGASDVSGSPPRPLDRARAEANLARLWRHVRRREQEYGAVLRPADLALFLSRYGVPRGELAAAMARIDAGADRRGALHRIGWWLERAFGRREDARAAR